ncbi:integrase core domain-containing protein [Kiritimatiellaeota bacterium B1221]|nr:integrase core domain-containing protein [Kiritimatiellaeota bacterium B1221]
MVYGHHLQSYGTGMLLPLCHHGLEQPGGTWMGGLQHHDHGSLRGSIQKRSPQGIINTDQGSQFTSGEWATALHDADPTTRISMDGKGRWVDNVFRERLWRSVKYKDIHLKAYETLPELHRGLDAWLNRYNHTRPHRALITSGYAASAIT